MRYRSIDLMRSYAIVVMVFVHFLENLAGSRDWSPDGFGAPIFTFLTGVSYRLWLAKSERRWIADIKKKQRHCGRCLNLLNRILRLCSLANISASLDDFVLEF